MEMKLVLCRTISNGYRIGFYLCGLEVFCFKLKIFLLHMSPIFNLLWSSVLSRRLTLLLLCQEFQDHWSCFCFVFFVHSFNL
nr:hypothetical protein CFP56_51404 [Quercus suber]